MATEYVDYYALLEVSPEADDAQVKKAYRKRSLRVHPDKRPDDPQAAVLFHELTVALDVLLDKETRAAFDRVRDARQARKRKFEAQTNQRQRMMQDLESREEKRQKEDDAEAQLARKIGRIKEEGRRMRESFDRRRSMGSSPLGTPTPSSRLSTPAASEDDRTVRVKFRPMEETPDTEDARAQLSQHLAPYGGIDRAVVLPRKDSDNKKPFRLGLVIFKDFAAARRAVEDSPRNSLWIKSITWTKQSTPGTPDTPAAAPATPIPRGSSSSSTSFSPLRTPQGAAAGSATTPDYESITLMRMKQAQRQRLEQEIREREAQES